MAAAAPIPIARERVVSILRRENHTAFVLANHAKILVRHFLASYIGVGDEIAFPIPTESTVHPEILIAKNSTSAAGRYLYETSIGYVSQPKQDKRNEYFVAAEVQRGSLGISTIFLPCEVLRKYFYHLSRVNDGANRRTLYEVLRIPAKASPAELRLAFKLREAELRAA